MAATFGISLSTVYEGGKRDAYDHLAAPDAKAPAHERRKTYDTTLPGRGNARHTFGDDLTEGERRAVIEYLKTI